MPALPDWPDRDVQTRFSPAAIPQPAPPPDTGPTVQWPTPRRSRRALLAGVLLGLTGLSVAGAVIVSTCTLCYAVSSDGSPPLAYVQGEDTYQTAVRQVEDQVSEILRSDYRYAQETTMALTIAPKNSLQTSDQLTASLMETVDQVKAEYILTIDGLPIGACESREAIDQALQGIKDTYTNQFTVSAYFDNTVDVVVGYLPAQAEVLGAQALAERLTQPRQQAQPAIEALLQVLEPAQELPRSMETLRAEAQAIDQDQGTLPLLTVCTVEEVTYTQPVEPPVQEVEDSTLLLGEEKVLSQGTPIAASAGGQVIWAGPKGTYGNLVKIDHGNGFTTYYAHCSELLVQEGDQVTQGQTIALVGSTGRSTGPHCHFELLWQDELLDPQLCLP